MLKLNILHVLIAGGAFGGIAALRREAKGRTLTPARLFLAPLLAFATTVLLLTVSLPSAREPALWGLGLAVGLVAGTARGSLLRLQVDRLWDRLRLPRARDGLWAGCLLAVLAIAAFGTEAMPGDLPWTTAIELIASTVAAACAGFLAARSVSLWLRSLRAPHSNLHRP